MGGCVERYTPAYAAREWCRTIWTSPQARDVWAPRLQRINTAWAATERASVGIVRPCSLQSCGPEEIPQLERMALNAGLRLYVLSQQGSTGSYQAGTVALQAGMPWQYRYVIGIPDAIEPFVLAYEANDNETMGQLLGFPTCCREFFRRVWVDEGWIDTSWPMAQSREPIARVSGPVESNILGRWLGVRWVPHLPCSFQCSASALFGSRMREVMRSGFAQEATWIDEILSWPMEWSAWHGIAEIKLPILKVSAKTDATAEKLTIQRDGPNYPEEGARGLRFPYQRRAETLIALSSLRKPRSVDTWSANGFSSLDAMTRAHDVVASVAPEGPLNVLDLGCGNGVLARRLAGTGRVIGVEVDATRAAQAQGRIDQVVIGNLADVETWQHAPADLVLLYPGRILELPADQRQAVVNALRRKRLLIYAYADNRSAALRTLCEDAGLEWNSIQEASTPHTVAALLESK